MGAVTYPDEKVAGFINENLVPVQMLYDAQPYAVDYNVQWTPVVIILDETGKEHHRTVGFLPPDEFVPSVLLGMLKTKFDLQQYGEAARVADMLIREYPGARAWRAMLAGAL